MKHEINSLKLTIPALALALALMGDIVPPCTASGNPGILPKQPPVVGEQSGPDMEKGVQPLSDIDDSKTQTYA